MLRYNVNSFKINLLWEILYESKNWNCGFAKCGKIDVI